LKGREEKRREGKRKEDKRRELKEIEEKRREYDYECPFGTPVPRSVTTCIASGQQSSCHVGLYDVQGLHSTE
jgi:hypothetical protein